MAAGGDGKTGAPECFELHHVLRRRRAGPSWLDPRGLPVWHRRIDVLSVITAAPGRRHGDQPR
jgi:hypothetical protein